MMNLKDRVDKFSKLCYYQQKYSFHTDIGYYETEYFGRSELFIIQTEKDLYDLIDKIIENIIQSKNRHIEICVEFYAFVSSSCLDLFDIFVIRIMLSMIHLVGTGSRLFTPLMIESHNAINMVEIREITTDTILKNLKNKEKKDEKDTHSKRQYKSCIRDEDKSRTNK